LWIAVVLRLLHHDGTLQHEAKWKRNRTSNPDFSSTFVSFGMPLNDLNQLAQRTALCTKDHRVIAETSCSLLSPVFLLLIIMPEH
jgi:hypothetical protein